MKNKPQKTIFSLAVCAAMSGCSLIDIAEFGRAAEKNAEIATAQAGNVGQAVSKKAAVTEEDTSWIPVKRTAKKEEPVAVNPVLAEKFSINRTFFGLTDVAERISILTGIPVSVSPESLLPPGQMQGGPQGPQQMQQMQQMQPQQMLGQPQGNNFPPAPGVGMLNAPGQMGVNSNVASISYAGTLGGFLDSIGARFSVSWALKNGRIEFYRYETKVFSIAAVPGDTTASSSLGGGSSGDPVSNITTKTSSALNVWSSIESTVKSMASAQGKVIISPSTGSLTVTDYPRNLQIIEKYIEKQNAVMTKQVVVNVRVLTVTLTDNHNYGINWDLIYKDLAGGMSYRLLTGNPVSAGVGAFTTAVLGTRANGSVPQMSGASGVIQALSKQGRVSTLTSGTSVTMNNQPVPMRIGKNRTYVAQTSSTSIPNVGTTTTMTPGTIPTGLSMNILPNIQSDGMLLMQYDMDITSLLKMDERTTPTASIMMPEVDTRTFMQRIAMRSGETIVMSGFEQADDSAQNEGIGSAANPILGGSVVGNKTRNVIVVILTANVVDKI